jgi:CarD family transcriptional regulator
MKLYYLNRYGLAKYKKFDELKQMHVVELVNSPMTIILKKIDGIELTDSNLKQIKQDIQNVLNTKSTVRDREHTWNRQYREYLDKIQSGSLIELAEVNRDLLHLREHKDLSFGERKMLDIVSNTINQIMEL